MFPSAPLLFDPIRRCFVAATPEEKVRQGLLKKMIHTLCFPKELIIVEKEIKELPHLAAVSPLPQRRVDILCYAKDIHPQHLLYPLLLVECKKESLPYQAAAQLTGYNAHINAYFVAFSNGREEQFGYLDKKKGEYIFHAGLPSFNQLLSWLKQSP